MDKLFKAKHLILLVDDSKKVQNFNKRMLERSNFIVETVFTLLEAKNFLADKTPSAIILDIGMPDGSGLDFLHEFRKTSQIPVLLLTGFSDTKDVISGFEGGCDDYLTKPYTFEVLLARLNRLLDRTLQVPETINKGTLVLKPTLLKAYVGNIDLHLTPKDFAMLMFFTQHENQLLDAGYIYENIWGQPMGGDSQALANEVSRLRKKLRGSGFTITAQYASGYMFEAEDS